MVRTITALGVGLVLLGAVLLAGPTFGFSTIAGDRGVNVQSAQDSDALVELDIEDEVSSNSDNELLFTVNNTFETDLTVDTELTNDAQDDDDISLVDDSVSVNPGQSEEVAVAIDEPNPDTEEITFTITAETTSGVVVTLDRGDVTVTNPGGGGGDGGSDGEDIWFDFETDTTINQIGVESNIDDADLVFRDGEPEFEVFNEEGEPIGNYDTDGNNVNQAYEADGTLENLDDLTEITSSVEVSVRIGEFGTDAGGNTFAGYEFGELQIITDENAADITVTLGFDQGEKVEIYFEETD